MFFPEFSHASFKCNLNNHTSKNPLWWAPSDFENNAGSVILNPSPSRTTNLYCIAFCCYLRFH